MAFTVKNALSFLLIIMLSTVCGCADVSDTITAPDIDINKSVIAILLPSDAVSGGEWVYTAEGEGSLSESSWDEYQEQEMAHLENEDDGMILLPEGIPPGCTAFVFKGAKPGIVDLLFVCSNPEMEETVKIEVFDDNTLAIIQY